MLEAEQPRRASRRPRRRRCHPPIAAGHLRLAPLATAAMLAVAAQCAHAGNVVIDGLAEPGTWSNTAINGTAWALDSSGVFALSPQQTDRNGEGNIAIEATTKGGDNIALLGSAFGFDNIALGETSYAGGITGDQPLDPQNPVTVVEGAVAIGKEATARHNDSVALGSYSRSSGELEVSVGNAERDIYRRITNLADGTLEADAVTLRQLRGVDATAAQAGAASAAAAAEAAAAHGTARAAGVAAASAADTAAFASQQALRAQDTADHAMQALTSESVALGAGATAVAGSVALGAGSAASEAGTVAVGGRRITQVAAPIYSLDAANREYVDRAARVVAEASRNYTDERVERAQAMLSAGIAAVAAQPSLPALAAGQRAVAVGVGSYNGASAVGVAAAFSPREGLSLSAGVSAASGSGSPVFKAAAAYSW